MYIATPSDIKVENNLMKEYCEKNKVSEKDCIKVFEAIKSLGGPDSVFNLKRKYDEEVKQSKEEAQLKLPELKKFLEPHMAKYAYGPQFVKELEQNLNDESDADIRKMAADIILVQTSAFYALKESEDLNQKKLDELRNQLKNYEEKDSKRQKIETSLPNQERQPPKSVLLDNNTSAESDIAMSFRPSKSIEFIKHLNKNNPIIPNY